MNGAKRVFFALMILAMTVVPAMAEDGMDKTGDFAIGAIKVFGIAMILGINMLWLIFPAGLGLLTYSYYKKKNEQSAQEDLGLKAAGGILGAVIVGFMAAYFAVGWIGMMSGDQSDLTAGNKFVMKEFLGKLIKSTGTAIGGAGSGGGTP
jgi:hypothetical protein